MNTDCDFISQLASSDEFEIFNTESVLMLIKFKWD